MKPMDPINSCPSRLRRILLLGLIVLAGGCAHMSKPTLGISGTNDSERAVGR